MDDDHYLGQLHAILTNPRPTGIDPNDPYGMADDGIDRYDGYGRDVMVETLSVVDGEHGAELVVTFTLEPPADPSPSGIPPRAVVHLPFAREWRLLSGYDEPAAYAPVMASRVMSAAHQHVERHRPGRDWSAERARERASLPGRDVQRQMLQEALAALGSAVEVAPGKFEVQLAEYDAGQPGGVVTVLVTPKQWEELLAWQIGDDYDLYLSELVASGGRDESFIVFYDGDLERSTREQLPPVRGRTSERHIADVLAQHPGEEIGWYAYPPDEPSGDLAEAGD